MYMASVFAASRLLAAAPLTARFARLARGFAARRALRARFGLEILLKIKPNEKYENLKFGLQTTT